jgi:hypothetical protein
MNKRLDDAIVRLRSLPVERQNEAAELLLDFLDEDVSNLSLTPEQISEIERRLGNDEPFATEAEVRETFDRLTK